MIPSKRWLINLLPRTKDSESALWNLTNAKDKTIQKTTITIFLFTIPVIELGTRKRVQMDDDNNKKSK